MTTIRSASWETKSRPEDNSNHCLGPSLMQPAYSRGQALPLQEREKVGPRVSVGQRRRPKMPGWLLTASPIRSSSPTPGWREGWEGMSTQAGRARPEEVGFPVDDTQGQFLPLLL